MEQQPFFSIVVPTYNRAGVILNSVNSVLSQDFKELELILVDDGSTDNTKELINVISDKRIKYFYQKNKERSAARNLGIEKASGRYICFLDSDDEYTSGYLTILYELLKKNQFPEAIIKSYAIVEQNGITSKRPFVSIGNMNPLRYLFLETFFVPCIAISQSIFKNEKFNESLSYAEDSELWVRILSKYKLLTMDFYSALIHVGNDNGDLNKVAKSHSDYIHTFQIILNYLKGKNLSGQKECKDKIIQRSIWLAKVQFDLGEKYKAYCSIWKVYFNRPTELLKFHFIKWSLKREK